MPLDPFGYDSFLGVNKRLDPSKIGPMEVQDCLDASFRNISAAKRLGLQKVVNQTFPKAAHHFDGSEGSTKIGNWIMFPHLGGAAGSGTGWAPMQTADQEWTLEAKIRNGDQLDIFKRILQKNAASPSFNDSVNLFIRDSDNLIVYQTRDQGNSANLELVSTTVVEKNKVYHIVIRKVDGATDQLQLWIAVEDGAFTLEDTVAINSPTATTITMNGEALLYIGAQESSQEDGANWNADTHVNSLFEGDIAEIRLWKEALSEADMDLYRDSQIPVYVQTRLSLYIPLDEGQGDKIVERTLDRVGVAVESPPVWSTEEALKGSYSLVFNRYTSIVRVPDAALFDALETGTNTGYLTMLLRLKLWKKTTSSTAGHTYYLFTRKTSTGSGRQFGLALNALGQLLAEFDLAAGADGSFVNTTDTFVRDTEYLILLNYDATGIYSGAATQQAQFKVNDNAVVTVAGGALNTSAFDVSVLDAIIGGRDIGSTTTDENLENLFAGVFDEVALWHEWIDLDDLKDEIDASPGGILDDEGAIGSRAILHYTMELDRSDFLEVTDLSSSQNHARRESSEAKITGFDEGAGTPTPIKAPSWTQSMVDPVVAATVHGIFDFEKSVDAESQDDTSLSQHIIVHAHNSIWRILNGELIHLYGDAPFNGRFPTVFQPFNNFLIIANQAMLPLEYDGTTVSFLTPETPSVAPTAGAVGVANLTGTYRWRTTFLNKNAGKRSIQSNALTVTGLTSDSQVVSWATQVAALTDPQVSHVELWMTLDGEPDGLYFFQGEYAIGSGSNQTTVTDDPLPSVEVLDTTLLRIPRLRYMVAHRARLWGVRAADPREVVFSPVNRPEHQEGSLVFTEPVTGLAVQNGQLIIFTLTKKYVLTGGSPLAFNPQPLNVSVGAVAQTAVAGHEDILYYWTRKGPYLDTYNDQQYIGGNIQRETEGLNADRATNWLALFAEKDHQVLFAAMRMDQTINDRLYILNLPRAQGDQSGGFEIHSIGVTCLASIRDPVSGELVVYAGWNGYVVQLFSGTNDGAPGASNLTGLLTAVSTTSVQNSAASWPTDDDGLRGVIFENVTKGISARILSNTITSLTFETGLQTPQAAGDSYRIAAIPFFIQTREEDFGVPHFPTFVSEIFLDLKEQTSAGTFTIEPLIDGSVSATHLSVAQTSTLRRARRPFIRSCADLSLVVRQEDPDVPVEIFSLLYRVRPTSKR